MVNEMFSAGRVAAARVIAAGGEIRGPNNRPGGPYGCTDEERAAYRAGWASVAGTL